MIDVRARFVKANGVLSRYLEAGETNAMPLFVVHGLGGFADLWLRNIEVLGRHFHVFAVDMLGHGFTDVVAFKEVAPHRAAADHLDALVEALGISRMHLMANSYGAYLAALLYLGKPERVSKFVVVNSATLFDSDAVLEKNAAGAVANTRAALQDLTLESCRRRLANNCFDASSVPPEVLLSMLTSYARPGFATCMEAYAGQIMATRKLPGDRVLDRLGEIAVPTLLAWGRNDPRSDYAAAVAATKKMKRARMETFESCNHYPFLEHTDRFNRVVTAFLQEG